MATNTYGIEVEFKSLRMNQDYYINPDKESNIIKETNHHLIFKIFIRNDVEQRIYLWENRKGLVSTPYSKLENEHCKLCKHIQNEILKTC